jgi:hypothetical protein
MATGWGVERANDKGFDTASARKINAAEYSVGVLRGCKISTSSTNRTYKVSRGSDPASIAVGSATAADGAVIFPVPDGLTTGAVAAGDPTNPRIDSVFAVQHDAAAGDADNQVVLVAVSGTPAASPTPPAAPAGIAVKLASFTVPKSASTTSQATPYGNVDFSVPYGASLGVLWSWTDTFNGVANQDPLILGLTSLYFPTDRNVDMEIMPNVSGENGATGTCAYGFQLDGNEFVSFEIGYDVNWQTRYVKIPVKVTSGLHTFAFRRWWRAGAKFVQHYGLQSDLIFPGTIFQVVDKGVAQ